LTEVISVRFVTRGQKYFFDPGDIDVKVGDRVIVETAKGLDVATCVEGRHLVEDDRVVLPLRPVSRIATQDDLRQDEANRRLEKEAFDICKEKIIKHELEMKLVAVECSFEGSKILFFFTSDGRVDFRELVKDLASVFRTRIELRQIGVRDETKMMGGLGICGRPYCCSQFLNDFEPVSTKMAKTQSMSLNPTKISGSCGRLMCCLRYEQEAYEDLMKGIPKNGAFVQTVDGYGHVVNSNVLRQKIRVRMDGDEQDMRIFETAQVSVVPGGRPKAGEPLPDVLRYEPVKAEEPEPVEDQWQAPSLFADGGTAAGKEDEAERERPDQGNKRRIRGRNKKAHGTKPPAQEAGRESAVERPQPKKNGDKPAPNKQGGKKGGGHNRRRHGKPTKEE
jgi:cell fate regulator YaaT (PSP1 superfamily)